MENIIEKNRMRQEENGKRGESLKEWGRGRVNHIKKKGKDMSPSPFLSSRCVMVKILFLDDYKLSRDQFDDLESLGLI